jgi:Zn-dependent protease with chaperone function
LRFLSFSTVNRITGNREPLLDMFTNFIYFIIVILIFSTYHPPEKSHLDIAETTFFFLFGILLFAAINYRRSHALARQALQQPDNPAFQRRYNLLFTQHAVLAIILLATNIYLLDIQLRLMHIPLIAELPTLAGILLLFLFICYLSIIWWFAHKPYYLLFRTGLSRRAFVTSHISFNIPIVLTWVLISLISDITGHLPFETARTILSAPAGQIFYFSLFLAAAAVYAPVLVQFFWKCRPLTGPVRDRIETLCRKAKFRCRNIMTWPVFEGKMLTAGVMGLAGRFRYLLITKSLISILTPEELDAVIAHEIGHIKKKHLIFYLFFLIGYMILSYALFDVVLYLLLSGNWLYILPRAIQIEQSTIVSVSFTLCLALFLLLYFRFLFGYFMRNCERQADLYAFTVQGHPWGLIRSLEKIAFFTGAPRNTPNWHHFSIKERIDYLEKSAKDKRWIARHDRKMRRDFILFFCGLSIAGYFAYAINFGSMGKTLNLHFMTKILNQKIGQEPDNADLHLTIGSLYHENREYEKAIRSYETALKLAPRNPETLNNLAWIYATCEEADKRDHPKALVFAIQAANLKRAPHILDTLAETYCVNGLYKLAVETEKEALSMNPTNRKYYEGQLEKFEDLCG